ncbi:MAG: hypothetical protein AB8A39_06880, partial [Prochlorococcus sp.]
CLDVALIFSGTAYLQLLGAFVLKHLRFRSYGVIAGLVTGGLAVLSGLLFGFYPAELFVLYWLIPAATWCYFCFYVRSYAEHPVVDDMPLPSYDLDTASTLVERWDFIEGFAYRNPQSRNGTTDGDSPACYRRLATNAATSASVSHR